MEAITKTIQMDDNRSLTYELWDDEISPFYRIKESFMDKGYSIAMHENFAFEATDLDNRKNRIINFDFDYNHPLYMALTNMLGDEDIIIFNDESISNSNKRFVTISKEDELIKLAFVNLINNKDKTNYQLERKYVLIENNPLKKEEKQILLNNFFHDVHNHLTNDNQR